MTRSGNACGYGCTVKSPGKRNAPCKNDRFNLSIALILTSRQECLPAADAILSRSASLCRMLQFRSAPERADGTIARAGANMVSPNVNKIFQEVQALNEAERQELQSLLENRAARQSKLTTQQEFDQLLRQRGVVRTVPPKPTPEVIA